MITQPSWPVILRGIIITESDPLGKSKQAWNTKLLEKIITLMQKFSQNLFLRYWPQSAKLKPQNLLKLAQLPKLVLLISFFVFFPYRFLRAHVTVEKLYWVFECCCYCQPPKFVPRNFLSVNFSAITVCFWAFVYQRSPG